MLKLEFLTIDRIIIHHIPQRAADKSYVEPTLSDTLVKLPKSGLDMFTRRIGVSLGHQSHGIKADFQDVEKGSFFEDSVDLMDGDDATFIAASKRAAEKLTAVQRSKNLSDSKLIVISGTSSKEQMPFSAVIKADLQDALAETTENKKTVIDYLKNVFLTESQRLFKIGFVQKNSKLGKKKAPEHFSLHLFDHLMTGTESRSAAVYFYWDFLGADVASSDKRMTRDFFEKTKDFLNSQDISTSHRMDLGEALRAELRSNSQTISVGEFGKKHLTPAMNKDYEKFMEKANFPKHAITKDTEYIKAKLKRRQKLVFTNGVMLTTPADMLKTLVTVAPSKDGSTVVTIAGTVESEE